jgi:hypothetical protein
VSDLQGEPLQIRVVDESVRPYGFVALDRIEQCER